MTKAKENTEATPAATTVSHEFANGQTLSFTPRQKLKKDIRVSEDGSSVTVDFMFRSGNMQTMVADTSHPLFMILAGFGISQKVGDSAASTKDVEDAEENVKRTIAQVNKGEWTVRQPASGGGQLSILVEALMAVKGIERDEASTIISNLPEDKLAQLKSVSTIKAAMDKVKLERMQARLAKSEAAEPKADEIQLDDLI